MFNSLWFIVLLIYSHIVANFSLTYLKASPIGLKHSATCKFCLTLSMKKLYKAKGVGSILRPCENQT